MSDADDTQARALVPEGPADDEATTGQEAATAAEMGSITSRHALPAKSPPQQVSCCCCFHPQRLLTGMVVFIKTSLQSSKASV